MLLSAIVITALLGIVTYLMMETPEETESTVSTEIATDPERIEDGIHLRTGLKAGEGMDAVIRHCTPCHSAKLVIQNRMDAAGWESTIHWMQETQNLWDLGDDQEVVIQYLTREYPVSTKGRRQVLKDIEWYSLEQ